MSPWTIVLIAAAVWWLWPSLFAAAPASSTTRPLSEAAKEWIPAQPAAGTATNAFASMEAVRDRMVEVGATAEELEQLTSLAPILLRVPPESEA